MPTANIIMYYALETKHFFAMYVFLNRSTLKLNPLNYIDSIIDYLLV